MTLISKPLRLNLEGHGTLTIRPNDHIATGGEGSVYRSGSRVIKLYTDPDKMGREQMGDKIRLLASVKHASIVAPECVVTNDRGQAIGYAMPYVDGEAFPRIFTNDFRARENFGDDDAAKLVALMRETVMAAHTHKAVMVDANELNWLMKRAQDGSPIPLAIDVDAWQIGKWPATVIMPSIRDPKAKAFTEQSDWFSFGIVSFQIFTGIHPFRGTLPGYKGNFLERMRDGKSVFEDGVRLAKAVRDFSCIPSSLYDWYVAMFKHGERTIPPSPFDVAQTPRTAKTLRVVVTTGKEVLRIERLLASGNDPIVRVFPCGAVLRKSGELVDIRTVRVIARDISRNAEVITREHGWLIASSTAGVVNTTHVTATGANIRQSSVDLRAHKLVRADGRLFAVTDNGLTELGIRVANKLLVGPGNTWSLMPHALKWFDGIGVQDALGAQFIVMPFGGDKCAIIRAHELDGFTPVDGMCGARTAAITLIARDGTYKRAICVFDADHKSVSITLEDVDASQTCATILSRGVLFEIPEDGKCAIRVPMNGQVREVSDHHIETDVTLGESNGSLVAIKDGALFRWSL